MNVLKRIGIVVLALVISLAAAGAILHFVGGSRMANAPDAPVRAVTVPTDAAAIARGEHLAHAVNVCVSCHGENLEGKPFIDGAPIGYLPAPNLTSGVGGIGGQLTDEQWAAAIRHGIGYDGRVLGGMPSNIYANISDDDLGALIAYLKSVPPVDNDLGPRQLQFPGTILFGVLGASTLPVNLIDHGKVGSVKPPEGVTTAYGEYLVNIAACRECHSANLAGNVDPNGPPLGPNITPGGYLADYNEAQFVTFMRSGVTPDGRQVSEEMPWLEYRLQTDDELRALWIYLSQVAPLPDNGQ